MLIHLASTRPAKKEAGTSGSQDVLVPLLQSLLPTVDLSQALCESQSLAAQVELNNDLCQEFEAWLADPNTEFSSHHLTAVYDPATEAAVSLRNTDVEVCVLMYKVMHGIHEDYRMSKAEVELQNGIVLLWLTEREKYTNMWREQKEKNRTKPFAVETKPKEQKPATRSKKVVEFSDQEPSKPVHRETGPPQTPKAPVEVKRIPNSEKLEILTGILNSENEANKGDPGISKMAQTIFDARLQKRIVKQKRPKVGEVPHIEVVFKPLSFEPQRASNWAAQNSNGLQRKSSLQKQSAASGVSLYQKKNISAYDLVPVTEEEVVVKLNKAPIGVRGDLGQPSKSQAEPGRPDRAAPMPAEKQPEFGLLSHFFATPPLPGAPGTSR